MNDDFRELDDERYLCCGGRDVHRIGCVNAEEELPVDKDDDDEDWDGTLYEDD